MNSEVIFSKFLLRRILKLGHIMRLAMSSKNMENHVLGFFMKNILFYIYLGIVNYIYTV